MLLIAAAEEAKQHEEKVDEIQIEGEGPEHCAFSAHSFIVAQANFQQSLRVVGCEESEDNHTSAADAEFHEGAAEENVDNGSNNQADEQHEQGAAKCAEVPLGDSSIYGHGPEHDGSAAECFCDGIHFIRNQQRPEQQPLERSEGQQQYGESTAGQEIGAEAHDDHDADGAQRQQERVFPDPDDGFQILCRVGGDASCEKHAHGHPQVDLVKKCFCKRS